MKYALILLLIMCGLTSASVYAADETIEESLDMPVSLDFEDHYVVDVADFIGKIFKGKVMFPKAINDSDMTITASIKEKPLRAVFDELGKQTGTTWKATKNLLVFSMKKK